MGLEVQPRKKHTGNICLYRAIGQHRNPVFLRKNTRRFLRFHQKSSRGSFLFDSNFNKMSSTTSWTPGGFANNLLQDRALIINLTTITNNQVQKKSHANGISPARGERRIEHIVDSALTIWDGHQNEQCTQNRMCSIIEGETELGKATIKMVEPFAVDPSIFHKRPGVAVGALLSNFSMQIAIIPRELTEDWPPLSLQLPAAQIKETTDESGVTRYPFLVVNWQRLPQLPGEGQALRIMARQDNKNLKTQLFASLDANYTAPLTPFKTYNIKSLSKQSSRAPLSESPQKVPTTPSKPKEHPQPIIKVRWFLPHGFEDIKDVEFQGYYCPICKGQYESVDMYHFHLVSSHDLFKFRVDWTSTSTGDDRFKFDVKVQFKVNNKYANRASNSAPDPEEFVWTRPKTLFNLDAYMRGGDGAKAWTVKETAQRSSKPIAEDEVRATKKLNGKSNVTDDFIGRKGPRIPLPSSIPDLPPSQRRLFKVPKAPEGVRFYHARTKIPLNNDEEYPESDDDIDETWLIQKHDAVISKDSNLSDAAKEFIICYDRHIFRERLSSSLHLGEALVRFARGNREFLQRQAMYAEFHKCMANLICHQCISPLTVRVCAEIVRGGDGNAAFAALENAKAKAAEKQGVTEAELDGEEVAIMEEGDEMEGIV